MFFHANGATVIADVWINVQFGTEVCHSRIALKSNKITTIFIYFEQQNETTAF